MKFVSFVLCAFLIGASIASAADLPVTPYKERSGWSIGPIRGDDPKLPKIPNPIPVIQQIIPVVPKSNDYCVKANWSGARYIKCDTCSSILSGDAGAGDCLARTLREKVSYGGCDEAKCRAHD